MENMDLNVPINLDSSISNTSFFAGLNANRAIGRGKKVGFRKGNLPYYNAKGFVIGEEISATTQPTVSSSQQAETASATPTATPSNPFGNVNVAQPSATSASTPTSTTSQPSFPTSFNVEVMAQSGQTAQTAQTPASTSTPSPVIHGGGGGFGSGGGGSTASEEKSAEKQGAGLEEKECDSYYWILGLAIGAIGGYIYAKNKKKEVLKTVLIASAVGGGAGFLVDKMICKNKTGITLPPKTEEKK